MDLNVCKTEFSSVATTICSSWNIMNTPTTSHYWGPSNSKALYYLPNNQYMIFESVDCQRNPFVAGALVPFVKARRQEVILWSSDENLPITLPFTLEDRLSSRASSLIYYIGKIWIYMQSPQSTLDVHNSSNQWSPSLRPAERFSSHMHNIRLLSPPRDDSK
jgi:hypothetical protein